jgi:hypothetical protein
MTLLDYSIGLTMSKDIQIPMLSDQERMILQNIMLRMSLEEEKIEKFKAYMNISNVKIQESKMQLELWKSEFNKKLSPIGLNINNVNINVETGEVIIANNVHPLRSENVDASG